MTNTTILSEDRDDLYIKKFYYSDDGYIEIGIPKSEKPLSVFISGGADSALVTYMVVKTIQDFNLTREIYPITGEIMARPYNINRSWVVLRKIEELTGFKFNQHLIFPIPNHLTPMSDDEKKSIVAENVNQYFLTYDFSLMFHGQTANPPIKDVPNTKWGRRQIEREDINLVKLKLKKRNIQYPLLWSDKKVVSELYYKLGIHETIFPLTRSCEGELEESEYFTKTCFQVRNKGKECWWCRERAYGFSKLFPKEFINTKEN